MFGFCAWIPQQVGDSSALTTQSPKEPKNVLDVASYVLVQTQLRTPAAVSRPLAVPKCEIIDEQVLCFQFDSHRHRLPAAQTESGQATLEAPLAQRVDESDQHACAGAADGVAQGDSPAIDVDLFP